MEDEYEDYQPVGAPYVVQLGEFLDLKYRDELITIDGRYFLAVGDTLRPIEFPWSRH